MGEIVLLRADDKQSFAKGAYYFKYKVDNGQTLPPWVGSADTSGCISIGLHADLDRMCVHLMLPSGNRLVHDDIEPRFWADVRNERTSLSFAVGGEQLVTMKKGSNLYTFQTMESLPPALSSRTTLEGDADGNVTKIGFHMRDTSPEKLLWFLVQQQHFIRKVGVLNDTHAIRTVLQSEADSTEYTTFRGHLPMKTTDQIDLQKMTWHRDSIFKEKKGYVILQIPRSTKDKQFVAFASASLPDTLAAHAELVSLLDAVLTVI
jgi:hypothetical protein